MANREKFEKAKAEHKAGGPYKSAMAATESPTFSKMHNERKAMKRSTSDGFMARTNKNSSGRKTDYVAMDKKEAEYRAARKQNKNKPIM